MLRNSSYDLGCAHAGEDRFDQAREWFAKAVAEFPDDERGWYGLAFSANRLGDHASALKALDRFLKRRPDDPEGAREMVYALTSLEKWDDAFEWARRVLSRTDDVQISSWAYATMAHCEAALGKRELALQHFEAAAALTPDDPTRRFNLAVALGAAGRWSEAEREIEVAALLAPEDVGIAAARDWVRQHLG